MHNCVNYILSFPNPEKWMQTVQTNHRPNFFAVVSGFFSVTLLQGYHMSGPAVALSQATKGVIRKPMISRKQRSLSASGGLPQHLFIQQLGFHTYWVSGSGPDAGDNRKQNRFDPCSHRAESLAPLLFPTPAFCQLLAQYYYLNLLFTHKNNTMLIFGHSSAKEAQE